MPLNNLKGTMTKSFIISGLAILSLAGCAAGPESVTTEHKGKVTLVHHRRRTSSGLVDKIEAISAKGVVTQAEIHVYDVGRLPRGDNGMDEAHRYYRVVQSERLKLMLPRGAQTTGPKTVFAPPNYTPAPKDQRINDAVSEAKKAKEKLEAAAAQVQDRLKEDNNLRGELQAEIDENQRLQDQINAGFNTPQHEKPAPQTEAQKAAESAIDPLVQWGQKVENSQP
jgi:peptidoglycan hydrolase CwlO-like protein